MLRFFAAALLASSCAAAAGAPKKADPSAAVCADTLRYLLPQRISASTRQTPQARSGADASPSYFVRSTEFRLKEEGGRYVLSSGLVFSGNGAEEPVSQTDLAISTAGYFDSGYWLESGELSDIDEIADMQSDAGVNRLSSVLLYLKYGKAADDFYRTTDSGKNIKADLPDYYGIRGSNLYAWYQCQSCRGAPEFTYRFAQDLRYTRLAKKGATLLVAVTRPDVVVAEMAPQETRYHRCPWRIGREIEGKNLVMAPKR